MFKEKLTPIGLEHPSETFRAFQQAGNTTLSTIRNEVTSPHKTKAPRVWGINDAARLIGISVPTLRKHEAENGLLGAPLYDDDNNRRVYSLKKINHYRDILNTRLKKPDNADPIICAVSNFKGGCAKTTTVVHLAQFCAMQGYRTLLIDNDPQGTATFICGGIIPEIELDYNDTIGIALIDNPSDIKRIIRPTTFDGLDIIPTNLALQDTELTLSNNTINNLSAFGSPAYRLKNALAEISNQYDIILIDCGPNLGILTINAIIAANAMLIPIPPNMVDYASFNMLSQTLQNLFESINTKLKFFRILLTRHSGSKEANNVQDVMRTLYNGFVLNNYMCDTIEIAKATNDLGTVYEVSKPRGSRIAFTRAITHLDNVNGEIVNLFQQIWDVHQHKSINNGVLLNAN